MLSKSSVPRQGRVAGIIFGDHFALAIPTSFFIISFDQLWSEDQFEAELNLPRRRRRGRNQPRRPADRSPGKYDRIGGSQIRPVERVKKLRAELQPGSFA